MQASGNLQLNLYDVEVACLFALQLGPVDLMDTVSRYRGPDAGARAHMGCSSPGLQQKKSEQGT